MNEEKKRRRNLIAKISGVVLGIVLVLGVSYAIFRTSDVADKTNRINTADFNVEIQNESEQVIALENAAPMSALDGQKQTPYTFDIVNTGTLPANYTLYLEVPNTSTLPSNKIKYYFARTDVDIALTLINSQSEGVSEPADTPEKAWAWLYSSLLSDTSATSTEDTTLYTFDTGIIGPGQKQSYTLNMWVAYAAGVEVTNKSFEGKIRVDAEQATDEVYPLETVSLWDKANVYTADLRASLYSDYSIRFEGNGHISTDLFANMSYDALALGMDTKSYLADVNTIFRKYGFDEQFNTVGEIESWFRSEEAGSMSEDMMNDLSSININYTFNGEVYFGDGITQLGSSKDSGSMLGQLAVADKIEKIYVSESVTYINFNFSYGLRNLKELHFTDIIDKNVKVGSLTLDKQTFSNVPSLEIIEFGDNLVGITTSGVISNQANLKTVTLPASLKTLHYQAIVNCPNTDVRILAKQSNVTISGGSALTGVKSVTWVNG